MEYALYTISLKHRDGSVVYEDVIKFTPRNGSPINEEGDDFHTSCQIAKKEWLEQYFTVSLSKLEE